jgi:hypothetical protein
MGKGGYDETPVRRALSGASPGDSLGHVRNEWRCSRYVCRDSVVLAR